jgi:hypothetical protein
MSTDLEYIYLHLDEKLSPLSINIGSLIVSLAFVNTINVIFLLIVILKNIKPQTSKLVRQVIYVNNLIEQEQPIKKDLPVYNNISPDDQQSNKNQMLEMSHLNLNQ